MGGVPRFTMPADAASDGIRADSDAAALGTFAAGGDNECAAVATAAPPCNVDVIPGPTVAFAIVRVELSPGSWGNGTHILSWKCPPCRCPRAC
jgi:hypothetical protein